MKTCLMVLMSAGLAASATAQEWSTLGGDSRRSSYSASEIGPEAATMLWDVNPSRALQGAPVFADGGILYTVRARGTPPESGLSPVVAMNLENGQTLWTFNVPSNGADGTTSILGVSDGVVYASRSGGGDGTLTARLYALDGRTGASLWANPPTIRTPGTTGITFTPDGDPIVAAQNSLSRLRKADGVARWSVTRSAQQGVACGAAVTASGIYILDNGGCCGRTTLWKHSLATGARLYGLGDYNNGGGTNHTPFVGADGTIYVMENQYVDAARDTGGSLVNLWYVQTAVNAGCILAADRSALYTVTPDNRIRRQRASDGSAVVSSPVLDTPLSSARLIVDNLGAVFVSNGLPDSRGKLYALRPDLTLAWSTPISAIGAGGPILARDGTLVVAGGGPAGAPGAGVRAMSTFCRPDFNADGFVDFFDYSEFVDCFEGVGCPPGKTADFNRDGFADFFDYGDFVDAFEHGC